VAKWHARDDVANRRAGPVVDAVDVKLIAAPVFELQFPRDLIAFLNHAE
jgi:hypothetical protein